MVGVSASFAAGTAPAWEPDANAAAPYGNVTFYDANGNEVTSGTNLTSPFAYVVANTAADPGATKASLAFYNPQHALVPGNWTGTDEAGPTTFSPSLAGAPDDITALAPTYPVTAASSADIGTWLSANIPDTTAGYANTIEVRLTDSGPHLSGNAGGTYWESDIGYNNTSSPITVDGTTVPANGWAQLFPLVSPADISLAASPTSPQTPGTQVTLTATVTPSSAAGEVQFFDGTTLLADSTTPGSGSYTYSYTPAAGDHSYTADFVPKPGDETGAYTATATTIVGSTSAALAYTVGSVTSTPKVTVTSFSPKRLGRGASNVGVTLTGTGFVTGATVRVSGISFSSVKAVNSTTITAKANVVSAKVGAATVAVADSSGSGSCMTCLTIVAAPTVKSITPSSLKPGASESVTVTGSGFFSGATLTGPTGVTFSKVKVVSPTKITATVKVAAKAKAGKGLTVTVINGAAGGQGRGTGKVLTIVAVAAPTVKAITPSSLKPGTSESVTITGTGFLSGATLSGPTGVTFSKVKVVSSTKITATAKVATGAKAGKHLPVTVIDGVAGGGSRGTGKVLTIT
jgi:hypothetical protein